MEGREQSGDKEGEEGKKRPRWRVVEEAEEQRLQGIQRCVYGCISVGVSVVLTCV